MKRFIVLGIALAILIGALSSHSKSGSPTTAASSEPASASSAKASKPVSRHARHVAYKSCDQNISAGPHTTCGFADNVFRAFAAQIGREGSATDFTIEANSPATGRTYSMSCQTSNETTECSGAKAARVRFPLYAARVYNEPSAAQPQSSPSYQDEESETAESPAQESEAESGAEEPACTNGTYVNSAGNTVCSPEESTSGAPAGATAECADGTYSFSESRSGTCSHHGGVASWLQ
jgi:hypothetical protein